MTAEVRQDGAGYEPAPPRASCDGMRAPEILDFIPALTYRKLDYWRRTGRLHAHTHDEFGRTGSGIFFCWPMSEVLTAALITKFIEYGFELDAAAGLARSRERMLDDALALEEVR